MRNLIVHPDGRLKTGRLSLILFVSLLLGFSLLFYLQKPVDRAVVVVRHIFNAPPPRPGNLQAVPEKPKAAKKIETPPQKRSVAAAEKTARARNKAGAEAAPKPGVTARKSPARKAEPAPAPAPPAPPRERVKVVDKLSPAAKKKASSENLQPVEKAEKTALVKSEQEKPDAVKNTALQAREPAQPGDHSGSRVLTKALAALPGLKSEPEESRSAEPIPEELVTDRQPSWNPLARKPAQTASVSQKKPSAGTKRLMSAKALKQLEKRYAGSPAAENRATRVAVKLPAFTRPAASRSSNKVESAKKEPLRLAGGRKLMPRAIVKTASAAAGQPPAITVARQDYYKLNQAWRRAGEGREKNDTIIPLRIENLRSAYRFLQMKPVVIRADGSCVDLNDGRRIPPQSLDRFSATVIEVNDPWEKWGSELRHAGLKPGDKFKVRYYLYDFIRRAVYARVNQAYEWARRQGLIPAATRPAEIDVLGRAYVVKRDGGGAFGVFVPLRMTSRDGRTIRIDPVAFNRAPEITALRRAGII